MKIILETSSYNFEAELNNTLTAQEIVQHLPVQATISKWGDEIYFDLGFKACAEGATMDVNAGDVAYWSQGKCLCIFFGPTPASENQKPIPASPVVIVGKISADPENLKKISSGEKITVSKNEQKGDDTIIVQ